jgi:hypothetical protein
MKYNKLRYLTLNKKINTKGKKTTKKLWFDKRHIIKSENNILARPGCWTEAVSAPGPRYYIHVAKEDKDSLRQVAARQLMDTNVGIGQGQRQSKVLIDKDQVSVSLSG